MGIGVVTNTSSAQLQELPQTTALPPDLPKFELAAYGWISQRESEHRLAELKITVCLQALEQHVSGIAIPTR